MLNELDNRNDESDDDDEDEDEDMGNLEMDN